jgi:hypothetical protein
MNENGRYGCGGAFARVTQFSKVGEQALESMMLVHTAPSFEPSMMKFFTPAGDGPLRYPLIFTEVMMDLIPPGRDHCVHAFGS